MLAARDCNGIAGIAVWRLAQREANAEERHSPVAGYLRYIPKMQASLCNVLRTSLRRQKSSPSWSEVNAPPWLSDLGMRPADFGKAAPRVL